MFDERDEKWISWLKNYIVALFWIYVAASVVLCIMGWFDCFYIVGSPFVDGLIFLGGGLVFAFFHLTIGMLIIQFLDNVQFIRNNIKNK